MKGDMFVTQIRMSDDLHQRIKRISDSTGATLNGTICLLLHMGAKMLEGQFAVVTEQEEEPYNSYSS